MKATAKYIENFVGKIAIFPRAIKFFEEIESGIKADKMLNYTYEKTTVAKISKDANFQ